MARAQSANREGYIQGIPVRANEEGTILYKKNKWKMKNRIFLLDVFVFELKSLSTKFIREFDKF